MKKKLIIIFFVMLMTALLGVVASADPDGPQFVTPTQYSEHKRGVNVTIQWNKPSSAYGTVDYYIIAVRRFRQKDDVTSDFTGDRIVNETCFAYETSYVLDGLNLEDYYNYFSENRYGKYRISVCAVMKDGTKRWSDHQYFYIAAHNTPKDTPVSFRIYNGFTQETKEQIYYACQNWNEYLNLGREIVNTYPFNRGTSKTGKNVGDGENVVTIGTLPVGTLMRTSYSYATTGSSKHKLIEADIVIDRSKPWSNSPQDDKNYVYNVITHEMGHVVGLNDKYDSWAQEWTMYGESSLGEQKKITLEWQDIINAKSLYQ